MNSSFEKVRGAIVERDYNRATVFIERNVSTLPLTTFTQMIDTLNDASLWGLSKRCVKLSNTPWRRELYGVCSYFYTVGYEFDIDFTTFDKVAIDEGTRVLQSGGTATNPQHYNKILDGLDNPIKAILDGSGGLWGGSGPPGSIDIKFYAESNFLLLGIPSSL